MENKKYLIWLNSLNGFGSQKTKQLLNMFHTVEEIYKLKPNEIDTIPFLSEKLKLVLKNKNLDYTNAIIEDCQNKEIDIIEYGSENYPQRLSFIYDPPLVLYKKGLDFRYDELPSLAIVGTRKASPYGSKVAEEFARDLSLNGITIISGMAAGIDTYAHTGAIKAGKPTIAVFGTGVDVVYPYSNSELYEYIVEYGAVLSEYPPGTSPFPSNFPQRNRIISALSFATLVVEADLRSGSLITADFANDQGKDVFAIPNNINVASGRGTNQLIKEYAYMVTCVSDIVEKYLDKFPNELYQSTKTEKVADEVYLSNIQKLSPDEALVVAALDQKPKFIDEIVRKSCLPPGKVNGILTILILKDIVYSVPGNSYALKF
jgi:DNA processing protein